MCVRERTWAANVRGRARAAGELTRAGGWAHAAGRLTRAGGWVRADGRWLREVAGVRIEVSKRVRKSAHCGETRARLHADGRARGPAPRKPPRSRRPGLTRPSVDVSTVRRWKRSVRALKPTAGRVAPFASHLMPQMDYLSQFDAERREKGVLLRFPFVA